MKCVCVQWLDLCRAMRLRRTHGTAACKPSEILKYPDVPAAWRMREPGATPAPLLTTTFRNDQLELRFLSTFTTFGTTWNVTIEELRIESMFPADEATAEICRSIAAG